MVNGYRIDAQPGCEAEGSAQGVSLAWQTPNLGQAYIGHSVAKQDGRSQSSTLEPLGDCRRFRFREQECRKGGCVYDLNRPKRPATLSSHMPSRLEL